MYLVRKPDMQPQNRLKMSIFSISSNIKVCHIVTRDIRRKPKSYKTSSEYPHGITIPQWDKNTYLNINIKPLR